MNDRARVIVADDHAGVLQAAAALLAETFDVVAAAPDGRTAIEAAGRLLPDAIVLDISMPGLDGFQTASRLRASGCKAPIVFLSNHAGDDFVLAGMTRGGSAFVPKVRMRHDLAAAVRHACAGRAFVPSVAVLPRWGRPRGCQHDLKIYGSDLSLVHSVVGFFESALEQGDAIIAIASHTHLRMIDAQLRMRGFDVDALVASARYSILDAAIALEASLRDDVPDAARFAAAMDPMVDRALTAAAGSPRHVSVFGEIAPILSARGDFDGAARVERIADDYAASRPIGVLCGYPASNVADEVYTAHAAIVPTGQF